MNFPKIPEFCNIAIVPLISSAQKNFGNTGPKVCTQNFGLRDTKENLVPKLMHGEEAQSTSFRFSLDFNFFKGYHKYKT